MEITCLLFKNYFEALLFCQYFIVFITDCEAERVRDQVTVGIVVLPLHQLQLYQTGIHQQPLRHPSIKGARATQSKKKVEPKDQLKDHKQLITQEKFLEVRMLLILTKEGVVQHLELRFHPVLIDVGLEGKINSPHIILARYVGRIHHLVLNEITARSCDNVLQKARTLLKQLHIVLFMQLPNIHHPVHLPLPALSNSVEVQQQLMCNPLDICPPSAHVISPSPTGSLVIMTFKSLVEQAKEEGQVLLLQHIARVHIIQSL